MSISEKTAQAYKWNTLSQVVNQVVLLAINIILVRLLSPEDFGMIALPFILFSLVRIVQDLGYSDVLIKSSEDDKLLHSSIYWLIVLVGILLSILFFLGHYLYGMVPMIIIGIYTLCIVVGSFSIGYEAVLRKEFSFKTLFYVDLIANVVSGMIGIVLAWKGYGWMALLLRTMIQYGLALIIYTIFVKWKPVMKMDIRLLTKTRTFATINIFDQILNYLSKNIDTFLIGLRFDKTQLGLYDRAYKLVNLPVQQTSGALSKVMLPEIAAQSNGTQPKYILRRNIVLSSFIIVPVSIFLFTSAPCIIEVVFGSKWSAILPLFQIFALSAWFQTLISIFSPYMAARDNNRDYLIFSILSKLTIIIGMAVLCYTTTNLVLIANGYFMLNMIVGLGLLLIMHMEYCKGLVDGFFVKEIAKIVLAAAGFYIINRLVDGNFSCRWQLGIVIALGTSCYLIIMKLMSSAVFNKFKTMQR